MEGLLDQIGSWFERGRSVALATVIKTWGSSPRPVGAMMAITDQGEISGSVSGGCVESAVIDAALAVIENGIPQRLHYGVANEDAWEVGLSCGGEIEVFIRKYTPGHLESWRAALNHGERFCLALVLEGDGAHKGKDWIVFEDEMSLQVSSLKAPLSILEEAAKFATSGRNARITTLEGEQVQEVFLSVVDLPKKLILVGGVHIAIPLANLAGTVGFEVIVIDPRKLFGTSGRFPAVKKLIQDWPQTALKELLLTPSTAIVMLTHDPKIDDPAIKIALGSPAFYIGALGSVKTHQNRQKRLVEQGIDPEALGRIHAPVGLDLGASTPEEIALAVMAEIIQVWHQRE
jgi:xanthine dehydrogenase accessory factor